MSLPSGILSGFKGTAPPPPGTTIGDHGDRHLAGGADELALQYLASNAAQAHIATGQTTTSTSFADLATVGPAVTLEVGPSGVVLVAVYAAFDHNTAGAAAVMAFALSGANVQAAADNLSIFNRGTDDNRKGHTFLIPGLAPGVTTFTAKYRTTTGTATFIDRRIWAVPL